MKKNVIILIVFGLPILFACKDDTFINEQIENSQPNTSKVILDSRGRKLNCVSEGNK
ncbi:hypothetical protein [Bacteroides thetaiotaomicron]|uniref:Lipoprotein n=1 Tax=Bacteroides thetaiotaomicron TaxID=818 RepID=A0AAP3SHE9_BACT4|nr:hypothetical protein [Bacteroides thetaiotaomicron]MDC2222802.1 hypothetical protein [Bacteroides thetaiotaomicron]MDC2228378.1 hypothetical protein [Bacteroides thetaiotaomicron]MDC2238105.1 hypothetical protein [Bacteroides thetaiotaomicron]